MTYGKSGWIAGYARNQMYRAGAQRVRSQLKRTVGRYPSGKKSSVKFANKVKSGSKTMTGKKKVNQYATQVGGQSITMYTQNFNTLPAVINKLIKGGEIIPQYEYSNGSGRVSGNIGFQTMQVLFTIYSQADLEAISSRLAGGNLTSKSFQEGCSAELYVTNCATQQAKFYIYDCLTRKDNNQYVDAQVNDGLTDQGASGGACNTFVGVTPFASQKACQLTKIMKVNHVVLQAGAVHLHRINIKQNKIGEREYFHNALNGNLRGWTYSCMVVCHGFPDNDSVTKTQVSTASTTYDFVYKKQYKYSSLAPCVGANNTFGNGLNVTYTSGVEDVMNEAAGTVSAGNPKA